ncbi:hypothetical protein ACFQ0G_48105 [Streptomyces chiangmaiensis]
MKRNPSITPRTTVATINTKAMSAANRATWCTPKASVVTDARNEHLPDDDGQRCPGRWGRL